MDNLEIWKSAGQSQIVIQRFGPNGVARHELIMGGRTFSISPEERRMNQNMAANAELDVFSNGMLQPVRLLDDTEEAVSQNPNHLSESELPQLFKLHWKTFENRVGQITNPIVLERLLEVAEGHDATVKQVQMVQARLDTIAPRVEAPDDLDPTGVPKIKPVTPR